MKAINLKTEYLNEPIGLDITNPRLSWTCDQGQLQSAYRIVAKRGGQIVWDTGKVESDRMTHVRYDGQQLTSRDLVVWSVMLWDEHHDAGDWSHARFELGLLKPDCWQGRWISGDYKPRKNERYPVDCFRKAFKVQKPISKARLYITACGLYEARINGRKAGRFVLAPGCTDYRKRIQYQTIDVTDLISPDNLLDIQLADGWYRGSIGAFGPTEVYGRQTKLLCQLEITYEDGDVETVVSDETFAWSNDGPIRFADLKDGEVVDASLAPSYKGQAQTVEYKVVPTASNNVDVIEQEHFSARLVNTPGGNKLLDFAQNIAGWVKFSVKGEKGQTIRLRMGEILDDSGELTLDNIQLDKPRKNVGPLGQYLQVSGQADKIRGEKVKTPLQQIEFVCSGQQDRYQTTFAVFGFRYASVEANFEIHAEDFEAVAIYSDMDQTGRFSCSNTDVNQFLQNTRWSMKGNFLDIPTDCPTRERLGWTGDAQIFFDTAADLMNVAPFFRKWLHDLEDSQLKSGKAPAVVPYVGTKMVYNSTGGSVGWGDALVLIPYRFWKRYGDEEILSEFYPMMRQYAMYMIRQCGAVSKASKAGNPYRKYTYEKGVHLGEWLEPQEFRDTKIGAGVRHTEECTAYLHYTMRLLTEIAGQLNETRDEALFREYAEGARKAYDWLFLKDRTIDTDRQAKLVRPLALGLLSGDQKACVAARLEQAVKHSDYCIGTGFLSTPFILPVLTESGRSDIAYAMLENTKAPSWLHEVKAGATTVWENWDGEASRNHYSPGAVCDWLFNTVAGIRVAGRNCFRIQPVPGGTLTWAEASYLSLYGPVSSRWQIQDGQLFIDVSLPANTSAIVILPDGSKTAVGAGRHQFTIAWQNQSMEMNHGY